MEKAIKDHYCQEFKSLKRRSLGPQVNSCSHPNHLWSSLLKSTSKGEGNRLRKDPILRTHKSLTCPTSRVVTIYDYVLKCSTRSKNVLTSLRNVLHLCDLNVIESLFIDCHSP